MNENLDEQYVQCLLKNLHASSLDAVVILAHDQVYHADGSILEGIGSFYVPNSYVLGLAKKHPEFLPAVSIHPARRDALQELELCLAEGAVMMKCLPNCHNIDCGDKRYIPFWERMAEAGMPLLAHTGGEHTVPVANSLYADPRTLELPLKCGVKVIAAHCGTKSGPVDPDYFGAFEEMTQRYPNFYGDNSAFNVPIRGRRVRSCRKEPLVNRMLHGSDYPVPVMGHYPWLRGAINTAAFLEAQRCKNMLERDYLIKRAMGFSDEVFTRINGLLRLTVS